ncbi:high mobility group box 3 [Coemansia sp. IMI 203386]|nr:high mobility group box 3 [Coemansia sp. IMI 203386]
MTVDKKKKDQRDIPMVLSVLDAQELAVAHKKLAYIYSRMSGLVLSQIQLRGMHSRPPRDPNAPKRPLTSYLLFCSKMREEFTKTNPGMTSKELASVMGHAWRRLGDAERKKYEDEAHILKVQFEVDMEKYKKETGEEHSVEEESDTEEATVKGKQKDASVVNAQKQSVPKKVAKKKSTPVVDGDLQSPVEEESAAEEELPKGPAPEKKKRRKHKSGSQTNGTDGTPTKKKIKKSKQ